MITDVENVMRSIFKRCVECEEGKPACTAIQCKENEICMLVYQTCDECAKVVCTDNKADPSYGKVEKKSGPNVGAIAGGVVGGIIAIAILTFIVWKFCLKGRRRNLEEEWDATDMPVHEKMDNEFASRRSTRASTHTVASMASSVLTRASNIIQIAYIPGVTNRSGPGSPEVLVPPVPPIPSMAPSSGLSTPYANSEQHFFLPDFRDSMASTTTDGRSSYARTSIAPSLARGSVASTMYRQNAIVSPLPAQTIVRGKAAVVSVKSSSSNSPVDTPCDTPPVPQIDPKHNVTPIRIQMPGLSRENSIKNSAQLGGVRALNITKKKASTPESTTPPKSSDGPNSPDTLVPGVRPLTEVSLASTDDGVAHARARHVADADSDSDDDDDHSRARRSLLRNSDYTDIQDTPTSIQSPFSDSASTEQPQRPAEIRRHTSTSSALRPPMTPIAEESSKRASGASKRTQSPFSDDNRSDL
jgi:hypothetical protein